MTQLTYGGVVIILLYMKNINTCTHCGKNIPSDIPAWVGPFCDPACGWTYNERATRRMGSLRRDADGDWQEDPNGDFGADHS